VIPTAPLPNVNAAKLDPERYHSDVHYTHNGTRVRQCLGCKLKGGVREKRAPWCKGRWRIKDCTFLQDDPGNDEEEDGSDEDGASENQDEAVPVRARSVTTVERDPAGHEEQAIIFRTVSSGAMFESALLHASRPAGPSVSPKPMYTPATLPPPNLDGNRYHESLTFISTAAGTIRRCKLCRRAGGKREETAMWCRGRVWSKYCTFRDGDGDDEFTRALLKPNPKQSAGPRRAPIHVPLAPPLGEGYYLDVRHSPGKTSFVKCQACAMADETRQAKAIWCKGRKHVRLCSFAKEDEAREGRGMFLGARSAEANDPFAMDLDARPMSPLMLDEERRAEDEGILFARPSFSGKRKREPSPRSSDRDGVSPVLDMGIYRDGDDGNSPFDLEIPAIHEEPTRTLEDNNFYSRAVSVSLPPSSPPAPVPADPTPTRPVLPRPTPSPSVSLTRPSESPPIRPETLVHSSSLPPSSPIFEPTPTSRTANLTFRPTPPSSISARSASVLSDAGSLSFPRRGILRRPSDFDRPGSVPRLTKRTRFSLAPLSPVRQVHSDPFQPMLDIDHNDDELLLGPSTSPAYAGGDRTIQDRATAALEHSREISIRARDVGFNLSAHTGRLSSDMLAALAPALSGSERRPATLGSSLRHSVTRTDWAEESTTAPPYSLPTPPPSHLAMTGRPGRERSASTGVGDKGKDTMPPPPVPQTTATARLPTPLSAEDEEDSDGGVVTPVNRRIRHSRSASRSRSRAQSMSAIQESKARTSSPAQQHPASTPRRRSKLEERLEIIAQTVNGESLEWGMDEDVGEDLGKMWREGSVVHYLE